MTNEDIIRSLPLKELARLLIHTKYQEDWLDTYGEDGDDESVLWGFNIIYVTSDGYEFCEEDFESALEHECRWLAQEASGDKTK